MASTTSTHTSPPQASTPIEPQHILPAPFTKSTTPITLLTQGAEALVYRTTYLHPTNPVILKYRPPKPYRHPTLDRRLTKSRILAEARVLVRVRKEGVSVPAVLGADWDAGWLIIAYVPGRTVRVVLDEWVSKGGDEVQMKGLMGRIGQAVAKLHALGVCHGDLTTSNLMLRQPSSSSQESREGNGEESLEGDIVLIDFGLAAQATKQSQDEDRAVDLYVLERAFAATHPSAEALFQEVLRVYGESFGEAKRVLKRLADVRLRGRKRSMIG